MTRLLVVRLPLRSRLLKNGIHSGVELLLRLRSLAAEHARHFVSEGAELMSR